MYYARKKSKCSDTMSWVDVHVNASWPRAAAAALDAGLVGGHGVENV